MFVKNNLSTHSCISMPNISQNTDLREERHSILTFLHPHQGPLVFGKNLK